MAVVAGSGVCPIEQGRGCSRLEGAVAGTGIVLGCHRVCVCVCAISLDQIDVGSVHSFKLFCPAYKPK